VGRGGSRQGAVEGASAAVWRARGEVKNNSNNKNNKNNNNNNNSNRNNSSSNSNGNSSCNIGSINSCVVVGGCYCMIYRTYQGQQERRMVHVDVGPSAWWRDLGDDNAAPAPAPAPGPRKPIITRLTMRL
jgi:hypothetical protein